jgi:hypothetical protein
MNKGESKIFEYGEFVETYSIDPTTYYTLKTHRRTGLYSLAPLEFQIMYYFVRHKWEWRVVNRVDCGPAAAAIEEQIWARSKEPWEAVNFHELVCVMKDHGVDMDLFEFKLQQTIFQNVVFSNRIICDAVSLMGEDIIQQAIEDDARFMQELSNTIKQVLGSQKEEKDTKDPSNVVSIWGKPKND